MRGKRVIVTAGAASIGYAIAQRFLSQGAQVAVCDVDSDAVNRLRRNTPEIMAGIVDVSSQTAVRAFVDEVNAAWGGIDVVVNNAGIAGAKAPLEAIDAEIWRRSFEVNVFAVFAFIQAAAPIMRAQGGGAFVNISTGSVVTLPANRADYIASKWALEGLTRAAARELGPANIRVNAIRPGFVDTERLNTIFAAKAIADGKTTAEVEQDFLRYISMGTKIRPEEIGDLAVFLASDAARHITGQLISLDGNLEWEE